jgi:3-dehydrosphinganine reductase
MGYFKGKKILITGGSSGIGKACAEYTLKDGAHVMIIGRRKELLDTAQMELRKVAAEGQKVEILQLDISDEAAVNAAAPKVLETLGGLDILINNAGIANCGYLQNETADNYREMMNINYFGTVWVTKAFTEHFMVQKHGHIGFTSSVLGLMGLFGYSAYAASKFAMTGYADCLRMDLLKYNIGVHVCFPPDTDTPQHAEELKGMPAETKAVAGQIKMMAAEDVAKAFLDGMAAGTYHIVPSFGNKLTMWAVRHLPGISRFFIDRDIKSVWTVESDVPPVTAESVQQKKLQQDVLQTEQTSGSEAALSSIAPPKDCAPATEEAHEAKSVPEA